MRKRILITGVTGNVGQACLKHAARNNWEYYGISRSLNIDLTDWEGVSSAMHTFPRFDLVVLTHGIQRPATLKEMTPQLWKDVVGNNLDAAAAITVALIQNEQMKSGGLIVYFSSIQATQPRAGRGAYATAKAGIEGLAKIAAVELIDSNVRTVALRIGQMSLPMAGIQFSPEQIEHLKTKIPLPWVTPEAIAKLVFSLYEQESLTGQVIEISSAHNLMIWE